MKIEISTPAHAKGVPRATYLRFIDSRSNQSRLQYLRNHFALVSFSLEDEPKKKNVFIHCYWRWHSSALSVPMPLCTARPINLNILRPAHHPLYYCSDSFSIRRFHEHSVSFVTVWERHRRQRRRKERQKTELRWNEKKIDGNPVHIWRRQKQKRAAPDEEETRRRHTQTTERNETKKDKNKIYRA